MKLTIHTERGVFVGLPFESQKHQDDVANCVEEAVNGMAISFSMMTENGNVLIGKGLIKTAVFVFGE